MKKIGYLLLAVLLLAQFIRPAQITPGVEKRHDLIAMTQPDEELAKLLKTACYDCHSDEPSYPWYASVTPMNWFLHRHITEGREHFTASQWGIGENWKRDHQAEEAAEMMEKHAMPLDSYLWLHPEARLTDAQYKILQNWFTSLQDGSWPVEKARRKAAGELR